jgi:hypothetical protein
MPGAIAPELDRELQAWTRRVQDFAHDAFGEQLRQLRVRLEDKEAIAALHWRGVPDEDEAGAVERGRRARREGGLRTALGRKVLEIRPPVRIDKGAGIVTLLRDRDLAAAVYVGDDTRPRRLPRPHRAGRARLAQARAARGVRSATRRRRRSRRRPTRWWTAPTACATSCERCIR